jgi:hypothetical protein
MNRKALLKMASLQPGRHHVSRQSPQQHAKRIRRVMDRANSQASCKTLITVPQTIDKNTCWFNAVLMVLMYSDRMRAVFKKALIHAHRKQRIHADVLQRFVSLTLLHKQPMHKRDAIYEKSYAHGTRPEDILKAMYKQYPVVFHGFNAVHNVVLGHAGGQVFTVLGNMLSLFGITANSFAAYDGKLYQTDQFNIVENPDVVCVFVNSYGHHTFKNLIESWQFPPPLTLTLNSVAYSLDASLMGSSNGAYHHAIAGVTCNNTRFYYNGWTRLQQTCPLIGVDFARKGIYISTRPEDECYSLTRHHATDFAFNGAVPQQDQILLYVKNHPQTHTHSTAHHSTAHHSMARA